MTLSDLLKLKTIKEKDYLYIINKLFFKLLHCFKFCQNVINNQYVKFYLDGFYIGNKLKSQLELPSKNSISTNNFCYNILVSVLMTRLLIFPNCPKENGLRNLKWQLIFTQIPLLLHSAFFPHSVLHVHLEISSIIFQDKINE